MLFKAILNLRPSAEFTLNGNELQWNDQNQTRPSDEEIQAEVARLELEYTKSQYKRDRSREYPPLTDLADAMYWASQGDNTKLDAYYAACEAVKLKYPKAQ